MTMLPANHHETDAYARLLALPYADEDDLAVIAELLGRPTKARAAVAARCPNGLPTVLRCDPRDIEGKPFPTLFWLCAPAAASKIGGLESSGVMWELTEHLKTDVALRAAYGASTERFLALRDRLPGGPLEGDPTQGGMPDRVKCLHALYAHWLATGDNPIGAWVAVQLSPMPCHPQCEPAA
jgi:hypothetical protein